MRSQADVGVGAHSFIRVAMRLSLCTRMAQCLFTRLLVFPADMLSEWCVNLLRVH